MEVKFLNYKSSDTDPIFLNSAYLMTRSNDFGWIGGYVNGQLQAVISYTLKAKFFFKAATFHSSTHILYGELSISQEKVFLNKCLELLRKIGVDFCSQSPTHVVFNSFPEGSKFANFGTYFVCLGLPEEELWSRVHLKHRNVILNAKKKGVRIKFGDIDNILPIYSMLENTMGRSKMKFIPLNAFMKIINGISENIEIVSAYYGEQLQGCAIFLFNRYGAYYLYGGSSGQQLLGSMNLLHWEAMKTFKSRGIKLYDFVGARLRPMPGSRLEGIQRFKSRFGAQIKSGYLWKKPTTKIGYIYFILKPIISWKNKDIIDQELCEKYNE